MESSGLCAPLVIYIVIAVASVFYSASVPISEEFTAKEKNQSMMFLVLWSVFFSLVLYMLCKKGHNYWSWGLLLAPIIASFLAYPYRECHMVCPRKRLARLEQRLGTSPAQLSGEARRIQQELQNPGLLQGPGPVVASEQFGWY